MINGRTSDAIQLASADSWVHKEQLSNMFLAELIVLRTNKPHLTWKLCRILDRSEDMIKVEVVEQTGENVSCVLPNTTDDDGTVRGAHKCAQLGKDASAKIMLSVLDTI
jgi:hypothetical protein